MAIIPPFFMDAVVALGVSIDNNTSWIGTGVLVGRKEQNDPNQSTVYIITNKHVVQNRDTLLVRFNSADSAGVKDVNLLLKNVDNKKLYSEHPMPNVDVVAIQIIPQAVIDNGLSLSFLSLDDHALTLAKMRDTGVDEGSLVYALGFPMNIVNASLKAPVCRLGCIARVSDAFATPLSAEMFLVDAQTFPGNSGGPIISRPEHISIKGTPFNSSAYLIGIISAYIPYQETLCSQQTKRIRMIQEENSGLTIVHPVDRIKEVVEIEWLRDALIRSATKKNTPDGGEAKEEALAYA